METKTTFLSLKDMEQKDDWRILLALAKKLDLEGIAFKVDGGITWTDKRFMFKLSNSILKMRNRRKRTISTKWYTNGQKHDF